MTQFETQSEEREASKEQLPKPAQQDFETLLSGLERVVSELEGDVPLEKALELFDKGMRLSLQCETFLKSAEQKVEILKRTAAGEIVTEPFENTTENGDN